ncbi:MAG: DinB family protein [Gemmatimonadaceae bacterium]
MAEPEVWMRGPVAGIPALLQPAAHSLLQCQEEIHAKIPTLTHEQLWTRPGGGGSAGFHVRHATGALDRLFTYARGEQLSDVQRAALEAEKHMDELTGGAIVAAFDAGVERALAQLRATPESTLLEPREVGRMRYPSNVLGLLFHTAEHTQRHAGQMATTVKVVTAATG